MKSFHKKHEILDSLESLDQSQTEKVLEYIKSLLYTRDEAARQRLKREAMKEIRQALGNDRKLTPSF